MDKYVSAFDGKPDLIVCEAHGCAYQADMTKSVAYDDAYFDKYIGYEGQDIANRINDARVRLVNRYASPLCDVLDIGIGSGEFIKSRKRTYGFDINEKAVAWLKSQNLYSDDLTKFNAFTFWDVLEHVPEPDETYFKYMKSGAFLFTSLPIFDDLSKIRMSKHYRPNEHYYYWTGDGFVGWMNLYGFKLLECSDEETRAGRESILSFAFRRN